MSPVLVDSSNTLLLSKVPKKKETHIQKNEGAYRCVAPFCFPRPRFGNWVSVVNVHTSMPFCILALNISGYWWMDLCPLLIQECIAGRVSISKEGS
jgi:hypothetical protein